MLKIIKKSVQKIFKDIAYKIFLLKYGKINKIKKPEYLKALTTKKVTFDGSSKYKIYTLKNSRLYTDRINNLAIIKKMD